MGEHHELTPNPFPPHAKSRKDVINQIVIALGSVRDQLMNAVTQAPRAEIEMLLLSQSSVFPAAEIELLN